MSDRTGDVHDDDSLGVLDDATSLDTSSFGILGGTAQVPVSLPRESEDDYVDDDDIGDYVDAETIDITDIHVAQFESAEDDAADDDVVEDEIVEDEIAEPADEFEDEDSDSADDVEDAAEVEEIEDAEDADVVEEAGGELIDEPVEVAEPIEEPAAVVAEVEEMVVTNDYTPASKRLGDLGAAKRETADLLTSERLVEPAHRKKPEPEGAWPHFLYAISGRLINIGDSKKAKAHKQLSARIATPLPGGSRFVAVLSRKGGVGKTTVTTLLGMALADAREDRVVAVDANPDRGTLADRISHRGTKSVRDLVRLSDDIHGYQDLSAVVGRDVTRLDVIASDTDPHIAEAFGDTGYRKVAEIAAHYYSIVLTDTGTGIVHSVMRETLGFAQQVVIVAGLSVDEAKLASETLTWLESNGHADLARDAIVVLNKSAPGKPIVQLAEISKHFSSRVREVVTIPYDPLIAAGGQIAFADLQPETRLAARSLAALVAENLRTRVPA